MTTHRPARDRQGEAWARYLVETFGWRDAEQMAKRHRDNNAPATVSFAHWNRICKALELFSTVERS